jgi:predicted enzyme related to lactoylglutathione lyase
MKKIILLITVILISFCSGFYFRDIFPKQTEIIDTTQKPDKAIKTKKVNGIGGIFFKCKDPGKIKEWYKLHLGLETDQYGALFEWQEVDDPKKNKTLQWSPFTETTTYFSPSTKDYMINYRVENLGKLVVQLKKEGVTFIDQVETYPYGKFVHIMDIEGNKLELYEPNYTYK